MNLTSAPPTPASTVVPLNPVGAKPVGQESQDLKQSTMKPVEQAASSSKLYSSRQQPKTPVETDVSLKTPVAKVQAEDSSKISEEEKAEEEREKQAQRDKAEAQQLQQEQKQIQALAARDREVRAHEQAHASTGGQYAGAPTYEYQRGPDGKNYAVGGEVQISTGKESTPEATIAKAQVVKRAALAPADPSPQDRKVAALASNMEAQARVELREQTIEEAQMKREEEALKAENERNADTSNATEGAATRNDEKAANDDTQERDDNRITSRQRDGVSSFASAGQESSAGSVLSQLV